MDSMLIFPSIVLVGAIILASYSVLQKDLVLEPLEAEQYLELKQMPCEEFLKKTSDMHYWSKENSVYAKQKIGMCSKK